MMKKLSIITINYNNSKGLEKTIESIIKQTYLEYEYIIIDGGSTDNSINIIKKYANKIDYWISEPDKGIFNAMNKGIEQATGEYCNFMNSGDCFHTNDVFEKVVPLLNKDIVTGKYIFGNQPHPWGAIATISMLDFVKGGICHQSAFIRRDLFKDNCYDENFKIVSDSKFFIDALIFKNCSYTNVDIIIADFDASGISSISSELNEIERARILREYLPERIYIDYMRFAKADSPLLELTPLFNKTNGFQKLIFHVVSFLIKMRSLLLRTKHLFYIFKK
ncbi:glycosyltransferase family 2 protein [uncultured Bacteroides sp.]|uniref:glycosyltransferase family 2 protein n=1 Tax=uncultured Bacteroides sp. TaxID=162156 RepID=UPI002AABB022|nr:glycosyltransferase family 2 protein [uncultured Bacteroides sp.]